MVEIPVRITLLPFWRLFFSNH